MRQAGAAPATVISESYANHATGELSGKAAQDFDLSARRPAVINLCQPERGVFEGDQWRVDAVVPERSSLFSCRMPFLIY